MQNEDTQLSLTGGSSAEPQSIGGDPLDNPAMQRVLARLKASQGKEAHMSHYTKHTSHAQKHSSTW
jgi:hypothetical protein